MYTYLLLLLIIELTVIACGVEHLDEFTADLWEDEISYTSIAIPRHSRQLYVRIAIESAVQEDFKPILLLRYNGLPTSTSFDASEHIPRAPEAFELIDNQPSESVLYIGLWGGVLPNSLRNFAGRPRAVTVSVKTLISSCDDEYHSGNGCNEELTPLAMTKSGVDTTLSLEEGRWYREGLLRVPRGAEQVELSARVSSESSQRLCSAWSKSDKSRGFVSMTWRLYLNHPDEDQDSARDTTVVNMKEVCGFKGGAVPPPAMHFKLDRPTPGPWRASVEVTTLSKNRTLEVRPAFFVRDTTVEVIAHISQHRCPSGQWGLNERIRIQSYEKRGDGHYELRNTTTANCQLPVTTMRATHGEGGALQLRSPDTLMLREWQEGLGVEGEIAARVRGEGEKAAKYVSLHQRAEDKDVRGSGASALFTGSLQKLDLRHALGGVVQIELKVRPHRGQRWVTNAVSNTTYEREEEEWRSLGQKQVLERLRQSRFIVSLRAGAQASDATIPLEGRAPSKGPLDAFHSFSHDALVLSTRQALVREQHNVASHAGDFVPENEIVVSSTWKGITSKLPLPEYLRVPSTAINSGAQADESSDHSDEGDKAGLLYVWTLSKPMIPSLTAEAFYGLESLFLRVTKVEPVRRASAATPDIENYVVSVGINIMHCHASSCEHGTCIVQTGDVTHSTCRCDYPYGGEKCDRMSIPRWLYVLQVGFLTLSNLVVYPGIVICVDNRMIMLAAALLLAACSSICYHLCDMDVWCLGGLDYAAYQVFDVFFCLLSTSLVVLHYAPVTAEVTSAHAILVIGVLVPAVVHSPTHPFTIMVGLLPSVVLLLSAWANYIVRMSIARKGKRRRREREALRSGDGSHVGLSRASADEEESGQALELTLRRYEKEGEMVVVEEEEEEEGEGVGLITRAQTAMPRHIERIDAMILQEDEREIVAASRALFSEKDLLQRLRFVAKELRYTIIGGIFALLGLAAFLTQRRDNYYLAHSVWHVTVMASTYFFAAGRPVVLRNAKGLVHKMFSDDV